MTTQVQARPKRAVGVRAKTLVINFVLDETGSMANCKDATISGFNEYVDELVKRPERMLFTLTKFNSEKIDIVHSGVPLKDVLRLNQATYVPQELTPLYDAVARTIKAAEGALRGVKGQKAVLCVIQTDGQENASREYDQKAIFDLVERKKAEGWTFAFLGADQDAWVSAGAMGVPMASSMSYAGTPGGTRTAFRKTAEASVSYAAAGGVQTDSFFDDKK